MWCPVSIVPALQAKTGGFKANLGNTVILCLKNIANTDLVKGLNG